MKTWNKEEIEAAWKRAHPHAQCPVDGLLNELEKPKPVFKVGEVVVYLPFDDDCLPVFWDNHINCRHLTPSEVPALALAIERLEQIAGGTWNDDLTTLRLTSDEYAQIALDDIKEMI